MSRFGRRASKRDPRAPDWMGDMIGVGGYGTQRVTDLNNACIPDADSQGVPLAYERPDCNAAIGGDITLEVYFQDLEAHLIEHIEWSGAVVGCMAWLTNERVLRALARKRFVSILVQKEDWLRPDGANWSRNNLLDLYAALPVGHRLIEGGPGYSSMGDSTLAPVRVVGTAGPRRPAIPRMHHKFFVFCDYEERPAVELPSGGFVPGGASLKPKAVWTGSFNATENGTHSLENAVFMAQPDIVETYRREWAALVGISEPLDWESEWVQPEYRIGT